MTNPPAKLSQTHRNLPPGDQERLQSLLSPGQLRAFLALAEETDPQIFQSDLMHWISELDRSTEPGHGELAGVLLARLSRLSGPMGSAARRAEQNRGAGASWGQRLERATHEFLHHATDPAMVLGLGVASTVFKGSYAMAMSRLAPAQRGLSLGALWQARAFSGSLALLAEGPAFVLSEQAIRQAMGEPVSWQPQTLMQHTLATYLTLGTLRGAGVLTRTLGDIPLTGARSLSQHSLLAAGEGMGIYANFGLQEVLGMRAPSDSSQRVLDSLVFFAQARSAGHLSHQILGPRYRAYLGQLEGQIRQAEARWQSPRLGLGFPGPWAPASAGSGVQAPLRPPGLRRAVHEHLVFSEALDPGRAQSSGGSGPHLSPEVIEGRMELMVRPVLGKGYVPSEAPQEAPAQAPKKIGILTSGGDSSGENAAIAALVEGALKVPGLQVMGIRDGFRGLLEPEGRIFDLSIDHIETPTAVRRGRSQLYGNEQISRHPELKRHIKFLGGNILRSSRTNPLIDGSALIVQETMARHGIEALVVLGGNGSQRASQALAEQGVKLVFLPQSIDADVPGSVVSIGFPSAVNEGALTIPKFLNTAQSCNRYFLVEVMGQRYGLLTLGIAYSASRGRAQYWRSREALPVGISGIFTEIPRSIGEIPQLMAARRAAGQNHGVILIGEGVQFHEASPPRETDGQNRVLIEAGDISRWVRQKLLESPYQVNGTRSVSLGYTLRGAPPAQADLTLAAHLARGALDLVQGGSFGRMVGMDFLPGEARWTRVFPKLSEVIGRPVTLDPQYFEHVRASVEAATGD